MFVYVRHDEVALFQIDHITTAGGGLPTRKPTHTYNSYWTTRDLSLSHNIKLQLRKALQFQALRNASDGYFIMVLFRKSSLGLVNRKLNCNNVGTANSFRIFPEPTVKAV